MRKADLCAAVEVNRVEQSDQRLTLETPGPVLAHMRNIYSRAPVLLNSENVPFASI